MGREVTLKGEFWQKKWRPRRIPCRVHGLGWTSRHGCADNGGRGQSVLNNYLGFLFLGLVCARVSRGWGLIKHPISIQLKHLIKMTPNLEPAPPCGWIALPTQSNSLKSETCSSGKSDRANPCPPNPTGTRRRPKFGCRPFGEFGGPVPVQLFPQLVHTLP